MHYLLHRLKMTSIPHAARGAADGRLPAPCWRPVISWSYMLDDRLPRSRDSRDAWRAEHQHGGERRYILSGVVLATVSSRDAHAQGSRLADAMKRLLRPSIVIPVVLGAALVVAFLTIADVRKVFALALGFQRAYLLYFFLLMLVYTLVRGVQWHYLLDRLDIRAPVRSQVFAFAVGEITKSLPIGNYFQNYLLKLSQGTSFARSAVATTVILATEVAVSLAALLALGLGDWSGWLRPAILIGTAAFLLLCALITQLRG